MLYYHLPYVWKKILFIALKNILQPNIFFMIFVINNSQIRKWKNS